MDRKFWNHLNYVFKGFSIDYMFQLITGHALNNLL